MDLGATLPPEGATELGVGSILTAMDGSGLHPISPVFLGGLTALTLPSPSCSLHGFSLQ